MCELCLHRECLDGCPNNDPQWVACEHCGADVYCTDELCEQCARDFETGALVICDHCHRYTEPVERCQKCGEYLADEP